MPFLNASAVSNTPFGLSPVLSQTPVLRMINPVMVQTISVSIIGPSIATKPSRIGSLVLAAPWAIASVPMPASFEKAARRTPVEITAPSTPPATAAPVKASRKISTTASGT